MPATLASLSTSFELQKNLDKQGLALLPSKTNPKQKRWQRVTEETEAPSSQATEETETDASNVSLSTPPFSDFSDPTSEQEQQEMQSAFALEVSTEQDASPLKSEASLEEHTSQQILEKQETHGTYAVRNEIRNHLNMLKLLADAVVRFSPALTKESKRKKEEYLAKKTLSKEESLVASGYLAHYAWGLLPAKALGYSAIVKGAVLSVASTLGASPSGTLGAWLAAGIATAASFWISSKFIWKGIDKAVRKIGEKQGFDESLYNHLTTLERLSEENSQKLQSLQTFTGKSMLLQSLKKGKPRKEGSGLSSALHNKEDSSLGDELYFIATISISKGYPSLASNDEAALSQKEAKEIATVSARLQPLLALALKEVATMIKDGDIPPEVASDIQKRLPTLQA